jgi:hypothetical protein
MTQETLLLDGSRIAVEEKSGFVLPKRRKNAPINKGTGTINYVFLKLNLIKLSIREVISLTPS